MKNQAPINRPVAVSRPAAGICEIKIDGLVIRGPVARAFLKEAEMRGRSCPELISDILKLVARDDLFAAVLDVGEP